MSKDRKVAELEGECERLRVELRKAKALSVKQAELKGLKKELAKEKYGKFLDAFKGVIQGVGDGFVGKPGIGQGAGRSVGSKSRNGQNDWLGLEPSEEFATFYGKKQKKT